MKFCLLVFINLAAIASIGSPNPAAEQPTIIDILDPWKSKCSPLGNPGVLNTLKSIEGCYVPKTETLKYLDDALPYLCLLTLNKIIELCMTKQPAVGELYSDRHETIPFCSFNLAFRQNYFRRYIDLEKVSDFLGTENKCSAVCQTSKNSEKDCQLMMNLLELTVNLSYRQDPRQVVGPPQILSQGLISLIPKKWNLLGYGNKLSAVKMVSQDEKGKEDAKIAADTKAHTGDQDPASQPQGGSVPSKGSITKTSDTIEKTTACENNSEKSDSPKVLAGTDHNSHNNINNANNSNKSDKNNNRNSAQLAANSNNKSNTSFNGAHEPQKPQETELVKDQSNKKDSEPLDLPPYDKIDATGEDIPVAKGEVVSNLGPPHDSPKDYETSIKPLVNEGEDDDNNDRVIEKTDLDETKDELERVPERESEFAKSSNSKEFDSTKNFFQVEDSHFSAYFLVTISIIIIGYVIYHNKNKIVAYALEGRRSRRGRRRPTSASYRKLDCNLEEAIASNPSHASVTNVVY